MKQKVHKMHRYFGEFNLTSAELHGDMSQLNRFNSLTAFSNGQVDFLLASDVAARGLDIRGVENVINFNTPKNMSQYVHRVGRTARIGNEGRSISFITEFDHPLMKKLIQKSSRPICRRKIPDEVVTLIQEKMELVGNNVYNILHQEKADILLEATERDLRRTRSVILNAETEPPRSFVSTVKRKSTDATAIASRVRHKFKQVKIQEDQNHHIPLRLTRQILPND